MNNPYPTLSPQSIQPYQTISGTSNQLYNRIPTTETIAVGVPVLPSQISQLTSQGKSPVPVPPSTQTTYVYNHLPQQQSNNSAPGYYNQGYQVQRTNSNVRDQNAGYVELTDKIPSEPTYAPTIRAAAPMACESNMPGMLYPQLPGSMTPSYSQVQTPVNFGGNSPIIYDINLLNGITSREPQMAHCTHCNRQVQTIVNYKAGKGAVLSGVFMGCMGGMPLLCSWVPCVLKDFKDAIHYCPVCGSEVGKKKFLVN